LRQRSKSGFMNQKKIEHILEKILQSNEFRGSESFCRLLQYLVKKSLDGDPPKESTIAIDVFDKNISSDHFESSSVRVYMHNLRQKLNSYYLNEGKDDEIRLRIPKGHYLVKFEPANRDKKHEFYKILIPVNIILLVIIFALLFFNPVNFNSGIHDYSTNSHMWNAYIHDDKPLLLVFGDYYLYEDRALNRSRYVRDYLVNSLDDFQALVSGNPGLAYVYQASNHTLLGKFAISCLHDLSGFFNACGKETEIMLGSNLQWEDLNRNNIVFVGSFKTLRLFKNLLNDHNFEYIISPNTLIFKDRSKDTTYSYQAPKDHATGQVKDYAILSRFPGPNQNIITIFSSTHDVGHISTVKYFTSTKSLEKFEKEYFPAENSEYFFDALFEVQGFLRTGFQPKLLHISNLEK